MEEQQAKAELEVILEKLERKRKKIDRSIYNIKTAIELIDRVKISDAA